MTESEPPFPNPKDPVAYWAQSPSIYQHIAGHIRVGQPGLTPGGETLPDAGRLIGGMNPNMAPGGRDGLVVQHAELPPADDRDAVASSLLDLIDEFCHSPIRAHKQKIHDYVVDKQVIGFIDPFVIGLVKDRKPDPSRVHELARSLAIESPDREPVKLGIALLGIFQGLAQQSLFKTLGRHDEFTLFCAVALKSVVEDPDEEIWDLARNVHGWGRVAAVQQLTGTKHAQVKQWMLREGYKNTVMNEYLAYTCAVHGGLLQALRREKIDDELLHATGEILQALLNPSTPAQGIHEYDDAPHVVGLYVHHMGTRPGTPQRIAALKKVHAWLSQPDQDWDTKDQIAQRQRSLAACDEVLGRPDWQGS